MRRRMAVVLAAAVLVVEVAAVPAAVAATGSGTASVGSVDILVGGKKRILQPPVAQCLTNGGNVQNANQRIRLQNIAEFGEGATKCTSDPANGRITVQATGKRFELNALPRYGGPRIRISDFMATCATTVSGAVARMEFSGLVGMAAPQDLTPNYTVMVPSANPNDPPLAKIILNEVVTPNPPDGSITLNLMHVIFAPAGTGPITGELVVGGVYCTPLV